MNVGVPAELTKDSSFPDAAGYKSIGPDIKNRRVLLRSSEMRLTLFRIQLAHSLD
jgi:hypothetical protein